MAAFAADLWHEQAVLLTGHTGFKGAWLALWLAQLGARVTGYALPAPTDQPTVFGLANVARDLVAHHEADLRDAARFAAVLDECNPRVILHLAAQPLVRLSYHEPRATFETNVAGVWNLLDAVRLRAKPCIVIIVTSDKCYENVEQVWGYRECDPMGGADPYSASKGVAELVVASYRRSFFHPVKLAQHGVQLASVRAGNVIGGGDYAADRIVPDLVRALTAQQPVPVRNPRSVRPWQHVLEPLGGYLTLAERMLAAPGPQWCGGWNFGPASGGECTVRELVERFIAAWGAGTWEDRSDPHAVHEAGVLRLCIDKAANELHWRPRWPLPETVRQTAAWYATFARQAQADMRAVCLEQIRAYAAA
jgi:CDP-glucose 4,6-dehydratase